MLQPYRGYTRVECEIQAAEIELFSLAERNVACSVRLHRFGSRKRLPPDENEDQFGGESTSAVHLPTGSHHAREYPITANSR